MAAMLRATWIAAVPMVPVSDSCRYDLFARHLAAGHGYVTESMEPTAYWPVGTSYLVSLLYRVFGTDHGWMYLPVAVMNGALGVGIVALGMRLAGRWFDGRVAAITGILLACWPALIEFTTVINSELPFIFAMLAAMAVWYDTPRRRAWHIVGTGLLLAGACLIRPTALLLPIVFGISDWRDQRDRRRELPVPIEPGAMGGAALRALAVALVMLAAVVPWSLRNQQQLGMFVLISANGGANFWMGNNPATTGFYQPLPDLGPVTEVQRDALLKQRARTYILDRPTAFVKRSIIKAVRLYERQTIGIVWNRPGLEQRYPPLVIDALKWAGQLYWLLLLALAAVGVVRWLWTDGLRTVVLSPPILVVGYFTGVHAVTVIQDRYHFPTIPFIAMLAAGVLAWAYARRFGSRVDKPTPY